MNNMNFEYTYIFRPDGDRWREQTKIYVTNDAKDIERIEEIFRTNPTEYKLVKVVPYRNAV